MNEKLPPGHFFGTTVASWRTGAFLLSESIYQPRTELKPHAHADAYLCLVVRGGHRETAGAQERHCTPSTVVFHPAGERHANEFCGAGAHLFRCEMDAAWLSRLHDAGVRLDAPGEYRAGAPAQLASRMFAELHARDSMSPLIIDALALEFAAWTARLRTPRLRQRAPEWMSRVRDYLHAHVAEEIALDRLASEAGVHAAHLSRVFRASEGCSVGEYVRRLRVERAAGQLATTSTSISGIAAATGFADQSHFSRVFSRIIGTTPARYRKLHRSVAQSRDSRLPTDDSDRAD